MFFYLPLFQPHKPLTLKEIKKKKLLFSIYNFSDLLKNFFLVLRLSFEFENCYFQINGFYNSLHIRVFREQNFVDNMHPNNWCSWNYASVLEPFGLVFRSLKIFFLLKIYSNQFQNFFSFFYGFDLQFIADLVVSIVRLF